MARYSRTFLVSYLRDICSLYYTKQKLTSLIEKCNQEAEQIPLRARNSVVKPHYENEASVSFPWQGGCGCAMAVLCLIWIPIAIIDSAIYINGTSPAIPFTMMIAGICVFYYFRSIRKDKVNQIREANEAKLKQYEVDMWVAAEATKPDVDKICAKRDFYAAECEKVDELLKKAYQANIIPGRYREMYAAVYLYDWFSNGLSDDLDMALNTFVLEVIKDKLDIIIKNQAEELINQRIMIANQQKSMEQQERHHRELMGKLDEIQTTEEERNSYLQMINANTATSAFYAQATYLRY